LCRAQQHIGGPLKASQATAHTGAPDNVVPTAIRRSPSHGRQYVQGHRLPDAHANPRRHRTLEETLPVVTPPLLEVSSPTTDSPFRKVIRTQFIVKDFSLPSTDEVHQAQEFFDTLDPASILASTLTSPVANRTRLRLSVFDDSELAADSEEEEPVKSYPLPSALLVSCVDKFNTYVEERYVVLNDEIGSLQRKLVALDKHSTAGTLPRRIKNLFTTKNKVTMDGVADVRLDAVNLKIANLLAVARTTALDDLIAESHKFLLELKEEADNLTKIPFLAAYFLKIFPLGESSNIFFVFALEKRNILERHAMRKLALADAKAKELEALTVEQKLERMVERHVSLTAPKKDSEAGKKKKKKKTKNKKKKKNKDERSTAYITPE